MKPDPFKVPSCRWDGEAKWKSKWVKWCVGGYVEIHGIVGKSLLLLGTSIVSLGKSIVLLGKSMVLLNKSMLLLNNAKSMVFMRQLMVVSW